MVRFLVLVTAAFFAASALADDAPGTGTPAAASAPEGKEQPPLTVLSAHVEER
jgi:hypothetical protein